ncbi:hypothetical protein S40293_07763 [Stachybotrys chartarum IBT 40293]|nr:hypothetical protein S40293_07763 [Stachybotrys chartarum IBT 40293]
MATPLEPFYKLRCSCNSYPWGKQGSRSLAARLCAKTPGWTKPSSDSSDLSDFKIDEDTPYAEMWMGTYPVLPSYVASTGEDLQAVLDRHPKELLGEHVVSKFGHSLLPFLPKVLSISKALPLQLHPNKEFASKLHEKDPEKFGDPNHKPEIALALSEFEAFCGFKPVKDIAPLLKLDPIKLFLAERNMSAIKLDNDGLRSLVKTILSSSDDVIKKIYHSLTSLPASNFTGVNKSIPKLAPRLASQYDKSDPGVLVALLTMNYLVLQPGEAIYIPADGVHAYLSGDIIECMARSDNVLNTGFCPSAERDSAEDFCSVLTFAPHSPEQCMLPPQSYQRSEKGKTRAFQPPLSEFNVLETRLGPGETEVLGKVGASIVLATEGGATVKAGGKSFELGEGNIYFVSQGVSVDIKAKSEGLLMHTAYVE